MFTFLTQSRQENVKWPADFFLNFWKLALKCEQASFEQESRVLATGGEKL